MFGFHDAIWSVTPFSLLSPLAPSPAAATTNESPGV